ncbi:50S ribosomal protein L17 [Candidatus Nitronereus thalassa]|uniref:Large ribosomal subunit protein bL17 n=1 Tax=Candidatus Nitronereus thalassa TaxID=3020898 RepID=A0ABU3KC06_9BACT|nr:50S ribosomal protein L17 [Candidatus Nitronereus thalassa]MDT7043828.1 50S ribosomal protein L17 [Candidatus Nitronereus thalassa]
MRHRKSGRQLGRNTKHRHALFRNLVTSLIEHERIETTEAKAKEIRGLAEKMITLGKSGTLHARRQALSFIQQKTIVSKLFDDVAGRFHSRSGGYTRIIPTRRRPGDAAEMVALELVAREVSVKPEKESDTDAESDAEKK